VVVAVGRAGGGREAAWARAMNAEGNFRERNRHVLFQDDGVFLGRGRDLWEAFENPVR